MDGKNNVMFLVMLVAALSGLSSCSEEDDVIEEYPNWKSYNETWWESLYSATEQNIADGDASWKIIRGYTYPETATVDKTGSIIVHVEEEGTGSGCPLYTDTVRVHYRGRLLPSTTYTSGYIFDSSYSGDFNPSTAAPVDFAVSAVIDGWITALQQMHIGDRWKVYVPYQLGYGKSDYGSTNVIPGYSTLVFDIMLVAYWHPGAQAPEFKARQYAGMTGE